MGSSKSKNRRPPEARGRANDQPKQAPTNGAQSNNASKDDEVQYMIKVGDLATVAFSGPGLVYKPSTFNEQLSVPVEQAFQGATRLNIFLDRADGMNPLLPLHTTIPRTLKQFGIKLDSGVDRLADDVVVDLINTLTALPGLDTFSLMPLEAISEDSLIKIEGLCDDPEAWSKNPDKWSLRSGGPRQLMTDDANRRLLREQSALALATFARIQGEFDDKQKDTKWKNELMEALAGCSQPLQTLIASRARHTFLLRVKDVQNLEEWPKHEDARSKGLLIEAVVNWHDIELSRMEARRMQAAGESVSRDSRLTKHVMFVSHKWQGNQPDAQDHDILRQVNAYCKEHPEIQFVWFDYCCVPQVDKSLQFRHLLSIPQVLSITGCVAFHANEELAKQYQRSVWCLLEAVLLSNAPAVPEPSELTIYDWKDLYAVLPGFLLMFGSKGLPRQSFFKEGGKDRAGIIAGILQRFINFHDSSA